MRLPRLLVLTDRSQLPAGRALEDTVSACVTAGVRWVVLREHDLPARQRQALLDRLLAAGAGSGLEVVTSRTLLPGARGVHLAARQRAVESGGAGFHGRSCHDEREVRRALADQAAYLTISPFADSASKPGHGPAVGPDGVRRARALAGGVPVFALGGMHVANVGEARSAGAHGVAVMGAVMRSADPGAVCAGLLAELADA